MAMKKHLLILGGGYGGTTLLHSLRHLENLEITLINQTPFHIVQTEIHRFLGGATSEDKIYFNLEDFCAKYEANFICDRAIKIDDETNQVELKSGNSISYDYLVIATGSVSLFPPQIENIKDYSQDVKIAEHLRNFQKEFDDIISSKEKDKNIVIVGGGLTGTEIALEYANRLKRLGIKPEECSVSIVEQLHSLLPGSSEELVKQSEKACDICGIKRYHGAYVTKIDDKKLYLSNDSIIPFSMVILTIGVTSEELHFKKD